MMVFGWFILALAVLHIDADAASKASNDSYLANVKNLYNHLMEDYKTSIRPVNHPGETITVNLTLSAFTVEDLDEKNQAFFLSGYLYQSWIDAGLVWKKEEYNGLNSIQIPISELWYPDVYVTNSKDAYYIPPTHHMALVNSDGSVMWIPPINIETHCELDLSDFPFDEHVCKVVFASWSHHGLALGLFDCVRQGAWHGISI